MSETQSRDGSRFSRHFTWSWTYPLKGIIYFARHRSLWPLLQTRLIPLVVLSIFVTLILFLFLYLPQVAILAVFHGAGSAWFNGTILVLGEAELVIAIFFEAFLVDKTQVDVVDAVLINRGHRDLVAKTRTLDPDEPDFVKCLGPRDKGAQYAPFSFRQIIEFVILLPLNFVPYVGVPLFLFATGARAGPLMQWRYFKLRGFDKKQRKAFIKNKSHRWQMTWFGTVALMLQLVPVASLLFLITNAAGTGLWAADVEDAAAAASSPSASRSQGTPADAPQEQYTDD